jgi:CrcB protein
MPSWPSVALIFLAGGIGSVARFLSVEAVRRVHQPFPVGTLAVNLLGCFAIGLLHAYFRGREMPAEIRLALIVGLLGGFTTFSSFGYETFDLLRQQRVAAAVMYVLASNALGVALVWAGDRTGFSIFDF